MNDFDKKLDFDSNTFENMKHDMNFVLRRQRKQTPSLQRKKHSRKRTAKSREIHQPRKSRRILPTTSWVMQTQKVTITKIRRSRYGTDETKSEQLCRQRQ